MTKARNVGKSSKTANKEAVPAESTQVEPVAPLPAPDLPSYGERFTGVDDILHKLTVMGEICRVDDGHVSPFLIWRGVGNIFFREDGEHYASCVEHFKQRYAATPSWTYTRVRMPKDGTLIRAIIEMTRDKAIYATKAAVHRYVILNNSVTVPGGAGLMTLPQFIIAYTRFDDLRWEVTSVF